METPKKPRININSPKKRLVDAANPREAWLLGRSWSGSHEDLARDICEKVLHGGGTTSGVVEAAGIVKGDAFIEEDAIEVFKNGGELLGHCMVGWGLPGVVRAAVAGHGGYLPLRHALKILADDLDYTTHAEMLSDVWRMIEEKGVDGALVCLAGSQPPSPSLGVQEEASFTRANAALLIAHSLTAHSAPIPYHYLTPLLIGSDYALAAFLALPSTDPSSVIPHLIEGLSLPGAVSFVASPVSETSIKFLLRLVKTTKRRDVPESVVRFVAEVQAELDADGDWAPLVKKIAAWL
eukprot:TRINITY_DN2238_c0_g1_i1.p1 TRINITY_DN2238_c0_g1~~TRINITY_DN2238_c0_g1_i1.p1  ORF type:complete len:309 (+),score=52.59 TRINITY_DN2238_c0_g1_i1:48-929(+)